MTSEILTMPSRVLRLLRSSAVRRSPIAAGTLVSSASVEVKPSRLERDGAFA